MKSKFEIKDNRTFGEKVKSFLQSLLFWRGRKKGMIHTRNLMWGDLRYIFFPKDFAKEYERDVNCLFWVLGRSGSYDYIDGKVVLHD